MLKSTARGEQFFTRTGSESTKGSRKGFGLLGEGECPTSVLSDNDRFFNEQKALRAQLHEAQAAHAEGKEGMKLHFGKGDAYFAARAKKEKAAQDIQAITAKLSEFKRQRKNYESADLNKHFVDWCRDNLPQGQFKAILAIAARKSSDEASKNET